jgi:hypothetical protein
MREPGLARPVFDPDIETAVLGLVVLKDPGHAGVVLLF